MKEKIWRKYERNMTKYEGVDMGRGDLKIIRGVGVRYADADRIPEMAPSTWRKGGSPARRNTNYNER